MKTKFCAPSPFQIIKRTPDLSVVALDPKPGDVVRVDEYEMLGWRVRVIYVMPTPEQERMQKEMACRIVYDSMRKRIAKK